MDKCGALTQKGTWCKLKCQSGHVYCNTHKTMCKDLITKYHSVCDPLWYFECSKTMTRAKIEKALADLEKCYRLRCKFGEDCCEGKANPEHLGALLKIQEKLEKCFEIR